MTVVHEGLALKEGLVRFMTDGFETWHAAQQESGTGFGTVFDTGEARTYLKNLVNESVVPAELFVIEPVMSNIVKMAAEELPPEASFHPDDLPSSSGLIYLSDPFQVEEQHRSVDWAVLDAISWRVHPNMVFVVGWADSRTTDGYRFRSPLAMRNIGFDEPVSADRSNLTHDETTSLDAALGHMLSALRIMQQPYAVATKEHTPRAAARRLARQGATSDITVITFRQPDRTGYERPDEPVWTLDHRVLVRGHWRRHQRYKISSGEWAEKAIYISPYIKGPEGTPLVITRKVNDLIR